MAWDSPRTVKLPWEYEVVPSKWQIYYDPNEDLLVRYEVYRDGRRTFEQFTFQWTARRYIQKQIRKGNRHRQLVEEIEG